MQNIAINGCGFNLEVASFSLEQFKENFKHSYCVGRSDEEIEETYNDIVNASKSLTDGKALAIEKKGPGSEGKRRGSR